MKYNDKNPDTKEGTEVESFIVKNPIEGKCFVCGDKTYFIDVNFMCFLCSEECREKLNEDFEKALNI